MSRYDWGKAHPEIDRLREAVNGARAAVVEHPVDIELYIAGMEDAGADIKPITRFLALLAKGTPVPAALATAPAIDASE
jgi:hypothetical protein